LEGTHKDQIRNSWYLVIHNKKEKLMPKMWREFAYSGTAQVHIFTRHPDFLKTINWIITAEFEKKIYLNRLQ